MSNLVVLATEGAEEGGGNFLIPDATFLAELVAFAIILAIMWKYVVPPLQRSLTQRQELIRKQIDDAKETKERLAAAEADYKKAVGEARAEAAKAREEGAKVRQEIIDSAREEARVEAEAVTSRAEARLEVERRQVLSELRGEIGRLAVTLAERIVGESLADDDRQRRVVDRFLDELEDAPAGGSERAGSDESGSEQRTAKERVPGEDSSGEDSSEEGTPEREKATVGSSARAGEGSQAPAAGSTDESGDGNDAPAAGSAAGEPR